MDTDTTEEERIEQVMELLPRVRRSMLHNGGRGMGPQRRGRRGGPPWQRGDEHHKGRRHKFGHGRKGWKANPAKFRIGMMLYRHGPAKVGDIAAWLGVSAPTASEQIDSLVEAGLAERKVNPEDRREVLVELTPKAMEMADYFWKLQRSRVEAVMARFTPEEQPMVIRTLEAIAEVFEQDPTATDDTSQETEA
jgi:DNA-binding MarR family transcriptional regulator